MPLVQDNSYLLDFDKESVIGYMFNGEVYATKQHSSIWKDTDNGRVFFNISDGQMRKMCNWFRGYETFYSYKTTPLFSELKTISVVTLSDIEDTGNTFWWINKNYDDAQDLSETLKKKDTPPQNIIEVA